VVALCAQKALLPAFSGKDNFGLKVEISYILIGIKKMLIIRGEKGYESQGIAIIYSYIIVFNVNIIVVFKDVFTLLACQKEGIRTSATCKGARL
jgi:hypothetical protein